MQHSSFSRTINSHSSLPNSLIRHLYAAVQKNQTERLNFFFFVLCEIDKFENCPPRNIIYRSKQTKQKKRLASAIQRHLYIYHNYTMPLIWAMWCITSELYGWTIKNLHSQSASSGKFSLCVCLSSCLARQCLQNFQKENGLTLISHERFTVIQNQIKLQKFSLLTAELAAHMNNIIIEIF